MNITQNKEDDEDTWSPPRIFSFPRHHYLFIFLFIPAFVAEHQTLKTVNINSNLTKRYAELQTKQKWLPTELAVGIPC